MTKCQQGGSGSDAVNLNTVISPPPIKRLLTKGYIIKWIQIFEYLLNNLMPTYRIKYLNAFCHLWYLSFKNTDNYNISTYTYLLTVEPQNKKRQNTKQPQNKKVIISDEKVS